MTRKTHILLKAESGISRIEFRHWLLTDYAPRKLALLGGAKRVALLLADTGSPFEVDGTGDYIPLYDAIIEIWGDNQVMRADVELSVRAIADIRDVQEMIVKDDGATRPVGRTPGVVLLSLNIPLPGAPYQETLRHWREHRPLALEIHHGMNRYVQNIYPHEPARIPHYFGAAHLHFPDFEQLPMALFRSAEDVRRIDEDVREFVVDSPVFFATEYIVKT